MATLVQTQNGSGATSASTNITPTAGNTLIAFAANAAGSTSPMTISDGVNTWTKLGEGFQSGAAQTRVEIWAAFNVSGSAVTVNVTAASSSNFQLTVCEFTDLLSQTDIVVGGGNASSTTAASSPQATANPNDLLLVAINYNYDNSGGTSTHLNSGGGWTEVATDILDPHGLRAAWQAVSATGSYSDGWTLSGNSSSGYVFAAIKASTTAGSLYNAKADVGATVTDTSFVATADVTSVVQWPITLVAGENSMVWSGPALQYEHTYKWRARYKDSKGAMGAWSSFNTLKVTQPSVVQITQPSDASQILAPSVTVQWNFTSPGGKSQAKYRVTVVKDPNDQATQIYDSGEVNSSDKEHVIPAGHLVNDTEYAFTVEAFDTDGV